MRRGLPPAPVGGPFRTPAYAWEYFDGGGLEVSQIAKELEPVVAITKPLEQPRSETYHSYHGLPLRRTRRANRLAEYFGVQAVHGIPAQILPRERDNRGLALRTAREASLP